MVLAYLALGSNMGDKRAMIRDAVAQIDALPETHVIARSKLYRTPPWGKTDQDWFANAALCVKTELSPEALLEACLAIETASGRERLERWGPRLIDIDLLIHGDETRSSAALTLPHPAITKRAFVLIPLREIAPHLTLNGQSLDAHLAQVDANGITALGEIE